MATSLRSTEYESDIRACTARSLGSVSPSSAANPRHWPPEVLYISKNEYSLTGTTFDVDQCIAAPVTKPKVTQKGMPQQQLMDSGVVARNHVGTAFKIAVRAVSCSVVVFIRHRSKLRHDGLGGLVVRRSDPQLLEVSCESFRSSHSACVFVPNESRSGD